MRTALSLILTGALGLAGGAYAADPPATHTMPMPGAAMPGGGMMHADGMDMGAMGCMNLSDQRLAAVKADLALSKEQQAPWDAFAAAARSHTRVMGQGMMQTTAPGGRGGAAMGAMTLPDRLQQQEKMMSAHLESVRAMRGAAQRLYGALTPEQRTKADRLLCGQMGPRAAAPKP